MEAGLMKQFFINQNLDWSKYEIVEAGL